MVVTSLQTGRIQTIHDPHAANPQERGWRTATFKTAVEGPLRLTTLGFEGDQQADRRHHGGIDKAALVYSQDHHAGWEATGLFGGPVPPGAFGENILVTGLNEAGVCVGDIYSLGGAEVEISQPRQPCRTQSRRWKIPDLVARMVEGCRSGWYLRVRREGEVRAGDRFVLLERPYPEWTVARAHQIMHYGKKDRAASHALAACPALSESWKQTLLER